MSLFTRLKSALEPSKPEYVPPRVSVEMHGIDPSLAKAVWQLALVFESRGEVHRVMTVFDVSLVFVSDVENHQVVVMTEEFLASLDVGSEEE